MPEDKLEAVADDLLKRLGLSIGDGQKMTEKYSGGMKRKLSLAIALIGNPDMLLLDEPSAAVDAAAKRHLWKVIKGRQEHQTVVMTTHSMEEAEACSDRLTVQVAGILRCLGSPLHLKTTYGSGYQLELTLDAEETGERASLSAGKNEQANLDKLVMGISEYSRLVETHGRAFLYQLPAGVSLGTVFSTVHEQAEALRIADYTITQPSMEQVFLKFGGLDHRQPTHPATSNTPR